MVKQLINYGKTLPIPLGNTSRQLKTPLRMCICGPSGCGKTNLLLNLIYDRLKWSNLYVYVKDTSEQKYTDLLEACEAAQAKVPFDYCITSDPDEMINIDDLTGDEHTIVVFDDFVTNKQLCEGPIADMFVRGRKKNVSTIFLTQSYFHTPKLIRLQCNYFALFAPRDDREILQFYQSHNCGQDRKSFYKLFHDATRKPYSFLWIDKDNFVEFP